MPIDESFGNLQPHVVWQAHSQPAETDSAHGSRADLAGAVAWEEVDCRIDHARLLDWEFRTRETDGFSADSFARRWGLLFWRQPRFSVAPSQCSGWGVRA